MSSKKKLLKKRKQKQLKRALKTTAKGIETATTETTILTPLEVYQSKLNEIYGGSVSVLKGHTTNPNASILCYCRDCCTEFYGKVGHIIGDELQRHVCGMVYGGKGDMERSQYVGGKHQRQQSPKSKPFDEVLFYEMVWNDYSYSEIASKLKIQRDLVKMYFQREGLI